MTEDNTGNDNDPFPPDHWWGSWGDASGQADRKAAWWQFRKRLREWRKNQVLERLNGLRDRQGWHKL